MEVKILEIRDAATFFPVICVNMNPSAKALSEGPRYEAQRYLLRRVGYPCDGRPNILYTKACGGERANNDPYDFPADPRTDRLALNYIIDNWDELKDGDVVDVEFVMGWSQEKKVSERFETGAF